jgi:GNAT superfamily N-acetyltransferase
MPADVVLRTAGPSDKHSIELVLSASFPQLLKGAYSESLLAAVLPALTRANPVLLACGTFYVAENAQGQIVGCGGWTHEKPGSTEVVEGTVHIRLFALHPDWSGRGIGRRIYEHCEKQVRETPATIFECYSTLNAEPFYAAMGFRTVGPLEVMMGGNILFPALLMRRSI